MSGIIRENVKTVFEHPEGYYILKREDWKLYEEDTDPTNMLVAYSTVDGSYIGDRRRAKYLRKRGIKAQSMHSDGNGTACIGFCEKENKWYGWSHRAIYGFGIGSTVKKGDCGYQPNTVEELYAECVESDSDGYYRYKPEHVTKLEDGLRIEEPCSKFLEFDDIEALEDEKLKEEYKLQYLNQEGRSYEEGKAEYDERKEFIKSTNELKRESLSEQEEDKVATSGFLDFRNGIWVPAESHFYEIKVGRGEWTAETMEDAKQMAIDFARSVS